MQGVLKKLGSWNVFENKQNEDTSESGKSYYKCPHNQISTVEPLYSGHHSLRNEILTFIKGWPYLRG